jgi:hypothetical protein
VQAALLLLGIAKNGDEDDGGFEIAADINVRNRDEADIIDVELAADGLASKVRAPVHVGGWAWFR